MVKILDTYHDLLTKEGHTKLELDTLEGQALFKQHINAIHELIKVKLLL